MGYSVFLYSVAAFILYLVILKIINPAAGLTNRPTFYISLAAMILGTQLFTAGYLGELIARSSPTRNFYYIEKSWELTSPSAQKVVIVGPGYPFRGGIATFNHRLCQQFIEEGNECCIFSFSLQYPSLLFPGKTQYSTDPPPQGLEIYSMINSIHPLNWWQTGTELKRMRPDILIVRYWLPFMGPAFGTILRRVRKNKHTRIIAITDNIFPHEKRPGDLAFSRYFLKSCDAFVTMSDKVMKDLRSLEPNKPAVQTLHPLYDNFGEPVSKQEAREKLRLDKDTKILLFFGFIRKYKGLDILLNAIRLLKEKNYTAAGPFENHDCR
jgi:Glycosyltransferase